MKTKNLKLMTILLLVSIFYSCSNNIQPNGKYTYGTTKKADKYIFEFKEDGDIKINFNNNKEFERYKLALIAKTDLVGNLLKETMRMKSVDVKNINYFKDNRAELLNLIRDNEKSLDKMKKANNLLDINYIIEFSKFNSEILSNSSCRMILNELISCENRINNALSNLDSVTCLLSGKWKTNFGGDIILSKINSNDINCKTFPDFNGTYSISEEPDTNGDNYYIKEDFFLKKLN